jgi:hypothetical protein
MQVPKHLVCLSAAVCLFAAVLSAQDSVPLPVRKVELYKNGMGYFEHLGSVNGTQTVEIVLPSAQLNDVLKSITVLDLGRGQIAGINYDSAALLERRLAELPPNIGSAQGMVEFLNQIRGTGIEIRTPSGMVTGRLMGAESRARSTGPGISVQEVQVSVFGANGEVRLVDLESVGAFRLTESSLAGDIGRYYDLLDTGNQSDKRRLQIRTVGSGARQILVSYTSESPIWKTTYRIVMDPKQKPLLQGWAIVDNTTPMDWMDVSLSLVSGAPISFIQDLSQPLYARRPKIPLPEGLQATPQIYEATVEDKGAERKILPTVGGISGAMAGSVAGEFLGPAPAARLAAAGTSYTETISDLEIGEAVRKQPAVETQASVVGEQFEYRIKQPVTIRRNESALLPILQIDLEGEKVAIFGANNNDTHPRLAFWLRNTSGLTLDAGSVTVIDSNTFAGEGLVETIQPGESRLMSYAVDLGTTVSTTTGSERQRVERIQISRGVLRFTAKMAEKKTYKIRNNNDTARNVVIEHPVRNGYTLSGAVQPAETSTNYYRFRIEVKPKTTADLVVQEESPQESRFSISSITPDQVGVWVRDRSIDPEIQKSLESITAKKNELNAITQTIAALDKEQSDIFRDQERLRGNLQRMGQTPEEAALRQRYVRQLGEQENRLAAMKTEREKAEASRALAQKQLDDLIQNLSLDKSLG